MKNIKKVMAMIMIVAVLFSGVVFGAGTSKNFDITTSIPAMAELKIHQTHNVDTISEFNNLEESTGHDFEVLNNNTDMPVTKNSGVFYLSVKTNAKTSTSIKATFNVMTGTAYATNTLDYTLNYGITSIKASENDGASLSIFSIEGDNGARVVSNSFSIDILGTDIETAAPDDYSATIIFEYSVT